MKKNFKKSGRIQRAKARQEEFDSLSDDQKRQRKAENKSLYDSQRDPYPEMFRK